MDVSAGQLKRLSTEELMPSNWTSVVVSQRKTNTTWYRWYMEPRVWHKETYLQNRLFYDLQNRNRLKYIAIVHGVTKCQTWLSHSLSLTLSPLTIQLFHSYWKNHSFDYMDPCQQSMSLLLHILSRFIIAFLPKSKLFLISWLQSPSFVILELKKIKSVTVSTFPPSICHEVMGPNAMILVF